MTKEQQVKSIRLYAGEKVDGKPVVEDLNVTEPEPGQFLLEQSPGFIRGLARGDLIQVNEDKGTHKVLKRSGNLCVRVIARAEIEKIAAALVPEIEKLGGTLDFQNARMLIFSIHVSCGFTVIEQILNKHASTAGESGWLYGNVYTEQDGELVPMLWWQDILKPE
jgi:hypothetical protein